MCGSSRLAEAVGRAKRILVTERMKVKGRMVEGWRRG